MIKYLLVLYVVIVTTGCATRQWDSVPIRLKVERFESPQKNEVTTKQIGETLVSRGVRASGKSINLSKDLLFAHSTSDISCGIVVPRGSYFISSSVNYTTFIDKRSLSVECTSSIIGSVTGRNGAPHWNCSNTTVPVMLCTDSAGFVTLPSMPSFPAESGVATVVMADQAHGEAFAREFIYAGMSGKVAKFMYREFKNDLARPAFYQNVEYDLTDSRVVGFMSLRIEIIEANNTSITYKLIRNFD